MNAKTKKILIASICAVLLIAMGVIIVYALIIKQADGSSDNTFVPGQIDCAVVSENNSYKIRNDGNTDAYIRAVVLVNWKKSDGSYYPRTTSSTFTTESNWTQEGLIYYYTEKVSAGQSTTNLIVDKSTITAANTNVPAGTTLEIRVLAEAIQATWGTYTEAWDAAMTGGTVGSEVRPTAPAPIDPNDPATCQHKWYGLCTQVRTCTLCSSVEDQPLGEHAAVTPLEEIEPTCTNVGSTGGSMCTSPGCGVTITEATVVPALGHNFVAADGDYKCSRCQEPLTLDYLDVSATDLQANMQSIFGGDTVFQETVMFLNPGETKQLLFPIDEIVAVQSYDGFTTYVEGRDYEVVDGKLHVPTTSTIKLVKDSGYYNIQNPIGNLVHENYNGSIVPVLWGDLTVMTQWQIRVIYKHSDTWEGFKQPSYISQYEGLIKKLMMGEDVTFIFYGDSITCGATSSWYYAIPTAAWYNPNETFYQWSYSMLFTQAIADMFGYTIEFVDVSSLNSEIKHHPENYVGGTNGTITYINSSVGGWSSETGLNNFDEFIAPYMEQYGCDLFGVAFGMNDINYNASTYTAANIKAIYDKAMAIDDDFHGLVISSMSPNNILANLSADKYTNFAAQETYLQEVVDYLNNSGHSSGFVKMYSMSSSMLERIDFRSYSSNNYNHPNDFMERVYAQTCLQAFIGYENIEEIPEHEHAEVTIPSKTATCSANGLTEGKMCSICYAITDAPDVTAPTEHNLSNGVCTVCHKTISYNADVLASVASGATGVTATVVDDHVNFALSGTNPTVTLYDNSTPLKRYMLIRYKGTGDGYGNNYDFYITVNGVKTTGGQKGNANWFNLNLDDQWHYIIVDLGTENVTSLTWTICDGTVTAVKGNSFDVEYVEFYDTYAEAKAAEVSRHPDGNIYPGIIENGSDASITSVSVPSTQIYYADTATNAMYYIGNDPQRLAANGKALTMYTSKVNLGYGNIYVTAALQGTYTDTDLGLQIGDGPVTWGALWQTGQANLHWVICNVSGQLAPGETKTLRVLIKNAGATIPEETILLLDTLTITMYDDVAECEHNWVAATCTTPKTCSKCYTTDGAALGHSWTAATCTTPKTCSTCKTTDGLALGHNFVDGVCTTCQETISSVDTPEDTPVSRVQHSPYEYFDCCSGGYVSYKDSMNIAGLFHLDAIGSNEIGTSFTQGMSITLADIANSGTYTITGWAAINTTDYTLGWSLGADDIRTWNVSGTLISSANQGANTDYSTIYSNATAAGYNYGIRLSYTFPSFYANSGEIIHLWVEDKASGVRYCFGEFKLLKPNEETLFGDVHLDAIKPSGGSNFTVSNGIITVPSTDLTLDREFAVAGWAASNITDKTDANLTTNYEIIARVNGQSYASSFVDRTTELVNAGVLNGWSGYVAFNGAFKLNNVKNGDTLYLILVRKGTGVNNGSADEEFVFASYTIKVTDSTSNYTLKNTVSASSPNTEKVTAPNEDASLKMWFDHLTEKVARYDTSNINSTTSSYTIKMARNEMEGCHFYLYSPTNRKVTIKLSDFTNEYGETLETELGVEFYIEDGYVTYKPDGRVYDAFEMGATSANGNVVAVYPDAVIPYDSYVKEGYGSDEGGYYMDENGDFQAMEYGAYVNLGPYCYRNWDTATYPLRDTVRGFTVQATTERDSRPGQYSATVEIYDAESGECIKMANVYTYVYDVVLSEETALDTAIGMWNDSYVKTYNAFGGYKDSEVTQALADFMLEYRLTPNFNLWTIENVLCVNGDNSWLYNPRVTTIKVFTEDMYNSYKDDPILAEKMFYYGQDEPGAPRHQGRDITLEDGTEVNYFDPFGFLAILGIAEEAKMLQSWGWDDYRLVAPFERNPDFTDLLHYPTLGKDSTYALTWDVVYTTLYKSANDTTINPASQALYNKYKTELENSTDMLEFLSNYMTVWVYSYLGSTPKAINNVDGCLYMHTANQDAIYGEYYERMKKYKAQGDDIWGYVSCEPKWNSPYQNILLFNDGTEARTMFWTSYKLGQTGWLYWREDYYGSVEASTHAMRNPFSATGPGDGILVYPGAIYGQLDPIPSIRMINMRDGIEDYQLLCMLEEKYGEAKAMEMVENIVQSVVNFTHDDQKVYDVHAEILRLLEEAE